MSKGTKMKVFIFFAFFIVAIILEGAYIGNLHQRIQNLGNQLEQKNELITAATDHMTAQHEKIKILKVILKQCGAQIPEPSEVTQ